MAERRPPVTYSVDDPLSTDPSDLVLNESETSTVQEEYQIRTLGEHNMARISILPIYPTFVHSPVSSETTPMKMGITSTRIPNLLLANVPLDLLTEEQYARVAYRAFPQLFKLQMDFGTVTLNPENNQLGSCESFLLCFFQNLFVKMKKRLKVDIPVIDFNLTRLRHCIGKVAVQRGQSQTMLDLEELFLPWNSIYRSMICSFNGVQPRLIDNRFYEGLFCLETPVPRFTITPCNKQWCLCCHTPCPRLHTLDLQQTTVIPFNNPHIHRFVNQYEAILNCPATCETKNFIYVLTCPCGQFDFAGQSEISFAETVSVHREESNRIIREFLIGETNIECITHGLKSNEKKTNDKMWLYQHSSCCSVALQLFLDYNSDYWCFVPMKLIEANLAKAAVVQCSSPSPSISTMLSMSWTRMDEEVQLLMRNVPTPPLGFTFTHSQRRQQTQFFKRLKDRIVPLNNVDVYNANIVAVLPDKSTALFRQLIESLLITHAECKLNDVGHLIYENSDPNRALYGSWCANLTRRP